MPLKRFFLTGLAAIALSLFVVGPAAAQDERQPKDRACVLDCREVHARCTHAAQTTARLCLRGCEDLVAKAREICAEAPDSEDCAAARAEAVACVRSCRETLRRDLRLCMADAKDCLGLCPDAQLPVPADPLCLRECRRQTSACLERARAAARECAEPCDDLVAKARRVCAAAPRSDECAQARREATACLQPCRAQLASHTRQCVANGQRCAASCPPAVDDANTSTRPSR
jgi:hypothetical protein